MAARVPPPQTIGYRIVLTLSPNFTFPEHWILVAVFFAIFAGCGLFERRRRSGLGCIGLGLLAVVANVLLLTLANRIGYGEFNLLQLLSLQDATVESTLILIGYCLMVRGFAQSLRLRLQPRTHRGLV